MKIQSGGVASGVLLPPLPRFLHRHPPVATTSTDLEFIRGGLQPFSADDISDDEATISYLGDGLAGGGEEEIPKASEDEGGGDPEDIGFPDSCSECSGVQSIPIDDPVMWARAQAGADAWMGGMLRKGKLDENIW